MKKDRIEGDCRKKESPELKVIIYTNEEKNKYIIGELCKLIAKAIYEKNFKPQSF